MVLITSTQINSQTPANVHFFSPFEHERQPICFIYFNIHGVIVIVVAVDDDCDDYVIVHCSHFFFHIAFDEKKTTTTNFYGI